MDLPRIMASLELEDSPPIAEGPPETRTLRKRTPSVSQQDSVPLKRRCSLIPQKIFQNPNMKDLEGYYRNENFKSPSVKSLETIYEEPLLKKGGAVLLVGANKQRRIIFNGRVTKEKLKKRKAKVRKRIGAKITGSIPKSKRLTMDAFLLRLHSVMSGNVESGCEGQGSISSLESTCLKLASTS